MTALADLSDADRLAILEDESHPDHERLIDELDARADIDADDDLSPDADAPFGYMRDKKTGERRPKKRPGYRTMHKQQQDAAKAAAQRDESPTDPAPAPEPPAEDPAQERIPIERIVDRAPEPANKRGRGPRGGRGRGRAEVALPAPAKAPRETIPFRAGPIAKGMNKLYRKIGKLIKPFNHMLGQSFIEVTKKEDEDDLTVGEAWEELAKVNPAIRGFLMKLVTGGAVGGVLIAHLPILIAIMCLEPVASRFPLGKILLMLTDNDDDGEGQDEEDEGGEFPAFPIEGLSGLVSGMSQADMASAMAFAQATFDQMGQRGGGVRRGGDQP